jgi:uncharacterized protein YneF (UPF0154 family)
MTGFLLNCQQFNSMPSKKLTLVVIIVFLLIWAISFGIGQYEKQDQFQLKNIPHKNISYIEVMNRGIGGKPAIYFRGRDSIAFIVQQLVTSPPITVDGINWGNSQRGCEIVLHYPNGQQTAITCTDMKTDGVIISSGAYHYRNDGLFKMFVAKFRAD